ncbi:MAG: hypothetical protein ABIJ00_09850 [Candidatus Eisenbacteria bacterium]
MLDERFIMHRFKAMRLSLMAGMIAMVGVFSVDMFVNRTIRWDLLGILLVMAVTKLGAMLYYQRTN